LVHVVKRHGRHAALMLLTGPVYVEVSQAHHRSLQGIQMATQDLIEQKFGIAVNVERRFVCACFGIDRASAINSRRRGVDKGDALRLAEFKKFQRNSIVVIEHVLAVALGGVRASPLMKDRLDILELTAADARPEFILVQVVGNLAIDQIDEFIALGQIVHNQDISLAAPIQAAYHVAADESGASGDYDHDNSPAVTIDVPSLPTTMPPARFAHWTASCHSRPAARVTASAAST